MVYNNEQGGKQFYLSSIAIKTSDRPLALFSNFTRMVARPCTNMINKIYVLVEVLADHIQICHITCTDDIHINL